MLHFNENTRELTSDSGYIKCIIEYVVYNHSIYLGIYDTPDNYLVATKEEWEEWDDREPLEIDE